MKVIIDCNVLVSAARSGGPCLEVILDALARHDIVLSDPVCAEYARIVGRPKHAKYRVRMRRLIDIIERYATVVDPAKETFGIRDSSDEIYLAAAKAGGADIVTGNTRDFTAPRYGPVEIFTPRAFLDRPS